MLETITNINSAVNNFVWGWPARIMLSFTGIFMTSLTKFLHLSGWNPSAASGHRPFRGGGYVGCGVASKPSAKGSFERGAGTAEGGD